MTGKRFAGMSAGGGISWLHRCLFIAALICAWQVIALDRNNLNKDNGLATNEMSEASEFLAPVSEPMDFEATAYCDRGITKSGVQVTPGVAAADPSVLPLGSLIFVENPHFRGVFRVLDTGRLVKGSIIDVYMTRYADAVNFGRQPVKVVVLQYGNPESPVLRAED